MGKFAGYDTSAELPQPVTGWYDTDAIDYPTLPEALFEMTDAQWDARMSGQWGFDGTTLILMPPPPLTVDQLLAQKIADGIAITSTSTPALNCTMALDQTTMDQIGAVARDVSSGLGLPGGLPSFTYPDIDGVPRSFNEAQIVALYKAQRDLLYRLNTQAAVMRQGGIPVWPPQTATIP